MCLHGVRCRFCQYEFSGDDKFCQSCGEDFYQESPEPVDEQNNGTDVYVAGYKVDTRDRMVATIWKNGHNHKYFGHEQFEHSIANSVFLSGNDLYVAGAMRRASETDATRKTSEMVATIWKNDDCTILSDETNYTMANSIFILNDEIYVAGVERNANTYIATIWIIRGNEVIPIQCNGKGDAEAHSFLVSRDGICVVGVGKNPDERWVARNWNANNGNILPFPLSDVRYREKPSSLFVSGRDVFAIEHEHSTGSRQIATPKKNGERITLHNDENSNTEVQSVYASGNDVYVAGTKNQTGNKPAAVYWKNGNIHPLTNGEYKAFAMGVFAKPN